MCPITVVPNWGEFSPGRNLDTARGKYSDDEIMKILLLK